MTARSQKFQKRGICTCLVKKIQFGKISAQRLVITAEKVWSHCKTLIKRLHTLELQFIQFRVSSFLSCSIMAGQKVKNTCRETRKKETFLWKAKI
jgi:hypothetical protein